MSEKCLLCWQRVVSWPNVQNAPGLARNLIFAAFTLTRTESRPRSRRLVREWIGLNPRTVRTSEASWASPVTEEDALNTMLTLRCGCMWLALLRKEKGMCSGDVEYWGESGTLDLLRIVSASMLSTCWKRHSAMLRSLRYQTLMPNTACTLMLATMHWARCSPRCKISHRRYWVISAVSYTIQRRDTPHTTANHWASEMQHYTGNSIYTEPSSHFWYTQTMQPCVGSSHNYTSPYVRWISWQSYRILTRRSSTSRVSRITLRIQCLTARISNGSNAIWPH